MRKSFIGFYQPTDKEYKELWKSGLIVFDTNVLLDLYRLPEDARNEVFNALEQVKDRIWIPHQVALEFQRRRFTVISAERKSTSDALLSAQKLLSTLESQVEKLEIEKRGLEIDSKPLIADLKAAHDKLSAAISKVHDSQPDIKPQDSVREKLDALLDGKVGKGFEKQAELDEVIKDGEERYVNKIPPGYEDSGKERNPNEAFFHFDGMKYPRKFGDLILWKQLIEHAKSDDIKHVMFITGDRKEDWWWKEQGKTIGPRSELIREIVLNSNIDTFWMYELGNFLGQAKKYTSAKISSSTLTEVDNVSLIDENFPEYNSLYSLDSESKIDHRKIKNNSIRHVSLVLPDDYLALRNYLSKKYDPDFIVGNSLNTIELYFDDIPHYYFLIYHRALIGKSEQEKYQLIADLINNSEYNEEYHSGTLLIFDAFNEFEISRNSLISLAVDIFDYSPPVDNIQVGVINENKYKEIRTFSKKNGRFK